MKKLIFVLLVALFVGAEVQAQDYQTGIGIRSGWGAGLTVKHFLNQKAAFEGLLDWRWGGVALTGLYEIHNQAFDTPRLNWYYGFGGHIGFWNGDKDDRFDSGNNSVIGIDGILGLEYNFKEIPINIGLDWKPMINVIGSSGFWGDGGAISIRYIF